MAVVSWKFPDCPVGKLRQVNRSPPVIIILPGYKKNQVLVRYTQVAGIKAPHIFEIASPDGQHLGVGRGVNIEAANCAVLRDLNQRVLISNAD
jgi:hypothetical protein